MPQTAGRDPWRRHRLTHLNRLCNRPQVTQTSTSLIHPERIVGNRKLSFTIVVGKRILSTRFFSM
jgi:hypothetical protein